MSFYSDTASHRLRFEPSSYSTCIISAAHTRTTLFVNGSSGHIPLAIKSHQSPLSCVTLQIQKFQHYIYIIAQRKVIWKVTKPRYTILSFNWKQSCAVIQRSMVIGGFQLSGRKALFKKNFKVKVGPKICYA